MLMKVLIIHAASGGSRELRDALQWLSELLAEKGIEVTSVHPEGGSVKGCVACGKCYRARRCIFDDEVNTVIDLMKTHDGLIVGSEVLFGRISEQSEHFLERLFHAGTDVLARKPASAVLCSRRRTDSNVFHTLADYFAKANMPVLAVQSGHMISDAAGSHEVLSAIASQMAWMLKCLEAGKQNDVDFADGAPKRMLDFVR